METKQKNVWKEIRRKQKYENAFRGLRIFFATTVNVYVYLVVTLLVVVLGYLYDIAPLEWMVLALAIGFVFVAEAINTAIEIDIDLTSPEYHPYARDTKDVAAGAVLIASITALLVGLLIFIPKIF